MMTKDENHSRGGAEEIWSMDGAQHGHSRKSGSCSVFGGVAGECSEVTDFWAGAGPQTAGPSCTVAEPGKVELLIQLQAILQKFQSPNIREDFCLGKIIIAKDYERLLLKTDSLYNVLFPTWNCTSCCQESILISNAATHFDLLYHGSPELFQIPSGNPTIEEHSYATWINIFYNIMNSKYWQQQTNLPNAVSTKQLKTAYFCQPSTTTRKEACSETSSSKKCNLHRAESINSSTTSNETLKSYCLGLHVAAGVDHSKNCGESVQQLQEQVIATTPEWFGRAIKRKKFLRKLLGQNVKLTWSQFLEEADKQDRKWRTSLNQETLHSNFHNNYNKCYLAGLHGRTSPKRYFDTRVFKNSQMANRSSTIFLHCSYCDRDGHEQKDCWRRHQSCLICGNPNHHFKKCAKYLPNYRQNHQVNEVEAVTFRHPFLENMFSDSDARGSEGENGEPDQFNDSIDSLGVESLAGFPAGYCHPSPSNVVEPDNTTNFNDCATLDDLNTICAVPQPSSLIVLPKEVDPWGLSHEDIFPCKVDDVPISQWESAALPKEKQAHQLVQRRMLQENHALASVESAPSNEVNLSFNPCAGFEPDRPGQRDHQLCTQKLRNMIQQSDSEDLVVQGEEELKSSVSDKQEEPSSLEPCHEEDAGVLGPVSNAGVSESENKTPVEVLSSGLNVLGGSLEFCPGRISGLLRPAEERANVQSAILEYWQAISRIKLRFGLLGSVANNSFLGDLEKAKVSYSKMRNALSKRFSCFL